MLRKDSLAPLCSVVTANGVSGLAEGKLLLEVFGTSCPSWVGVRAQQDILEEMPHVLLRNSWEEGLVGWWVGLIHSFREHLWRPPCRALCAHGVCMALSPSPEEFTVQGGDG